ncbi:hypothetical protein EPI10_016246 [Gossypium australe]|uniref:Uncharacterized protein n=1 Tax=Gossypium australe TaxID=47621 RepID=A0A5B6VND4_9ROSI|nr:hypothetical protein EPI10_016246 [Gossypium australe]
MENLAGFMKKSKNDIYEVHDKNTLDLLDAQIERLTRRLGNDDVVDQPHIRGNNARCAPCANDETLVNNDLGQPSSAKPKLSIPQFWGKHDPERARNENLTHCSRQSIIDYFKGMEMFIQ